MSETRAALCSGQGRAGYCATSREQCMAPPTNHRTPAIQARVDPPGACLQRQGEPVDRTSHGHRYHREGVISVTFAPPFSFILHQVEPAPVDSDIAVHAGVQESLLPSCFRYLPSGFPNGYYAFNVLWLDPRVCACLSPVVGGTAGLRA